VLAAAGQDAAAALVPCNAKDFCSWQKLNVL
jgi:hypothetical protein